MTLTVGRVTLPEPQRWVVDADDDETHTITGFLRGDTSLAQARAKREQFRGMVNHLIPIYSTHDSGNDGFFILRSADIERRQKDAADQGTGYFRYQIVASYLGSASQVEIQSLLTHVRINNTHGLDTNAEVSFGHAPAVGAVALDHGDSVPTAWSRATQDGTIPIILGMADVDPTWSVEPNTYYGGSVRIEVGTDGSNPIVRTGLIAPNLPANWKLSNGIMEITPGVTSGVANGRIQVAFWNGSTFSTPKLFKFIFDPSGSASTVPGWDYITLIHNTPELGIIRLIRDANEAPATVHRHILDITLRRGYPFFYGYYTWTGAPVNWKVVRDTNEATTAVTPTGASNAVGIRANANDASGNRFILYSALAFTADNTAGGLTFSSVRTFDFGIGAAIGGSSAGALDVPNELGIQYFAWSGEQSRAVRR